ncbi:MAG: sulfite exporter TauE/SafE family protein [Tepidisphaeraceae bacterium]
MLLIPAIFFASLLGSLHCAGMCGAFVALAVNGANEGASKIATQSAYHLGRLVTYVTLGAIAGTLGSLLNVAAKLAGLQPVAYAFAGASMVIFAGIALLRINGVKIARLPLPGFMQELLVRGHRVAMHRTPIARAATIGLLTTLLPCGWLYAFVITAAGTGSTLLGAGAMAVFWLGTLPMLVTIGTGAGDARRVREEAADRHLPDRPRCGPLDAAGPLAPQPAGDGPAASTDHSSDEHAHHRAVGPRTSALLSS